MLLEPLAKPLTRVRQLTLQPRTGGRVQGVGGGLVDASGLRLALGELCELRPRAATPLLAEVVGVSPSSCRLAPLGSLSGLAQGDLIVPCPDGLSLPPAGRLLGRVVDALGMPLDGGATPTSRGLARVDGAAPTLPERRPISRCLPTRLAALDGLLTLGHGQRIGIFAGSGVGKSTLLSALTRQSSVDRVVMALVGERGREVSELFESLGPELRARTIVVAATSDTAAALRLLAPRTAVALAEELRDQGQDVLVVIDSITRFALAAREVSITAGEPPSSRGFPPSVFARLPLLLERLGATERGSLTGVMTVLVEGDRIEEDPLADTLRGLLDGHVVLSRELAERGHYPAIDVPKSVSRTMRQATTPEHSQRAARVRVLISALRRAEELVEIGAYRPGADPLLDEALAKAEALRGFLVQGDEARELADTLTELARLAGPLERRP